MSQVTLSPLPEKTDILRILPLSDLHLPKPASRLILNNRALLDSLDYVVLMGDMVTAYGTKLEYAAVREFVNGLKVPYTAVSGNHEWFFKEYGEESGKYLEFWDEAERPEKLQKIENFKQFYGVSTIWRSFQNPLGKFVFLSLDDTQAPKQEAITQEQIDWFVGEIKAAGNQPIFVFCHCPVMLEKRLDFVYYDETRTGCIDTKGELKRALQTREAPTFWMSGHVHLHPDHYLFPPYRAGGNVWQIHCPDSWGYGRWAREHRIPKRYDFPYSRVLQIDAKGVSFETHEHNTQTRRETYRVDF